MRMEYTSTITNVIIKGTFVKKGFLQGLPILKASAVNMYIKLQKRNKMLSSGISALNVSVVVK